MANKKRQLLKEGQTRVTPQTFPAGGYQAGSNTANQRGEASIDIMQPFTGQVPINHAKVFNDELPAAEGGYLFPYTLDSIQDALVRIMEGTAEAKNMMENTISHPSMHKEQKELIKQQIALYSNIEKLVIKSVEKIEQLTIGGK